MAICFRVLEILCSRRKRRGHELGQARPLVTSHFPKSAWEPNSTHQEDGDPAREVRSRDLKGSPGSSQGLDFFLAVTPI